MGAARPQAGLRWNAEGPTGALFLCACGAQWSGRRAMRLVRRVPAGTCRCPAVAPRLPSTVCRVPSAACRCVGAVRRFARPAHRPSEAARRVPALARRGLSVARRAHGLAGEVQGSGAPSRSVRCAGRKARRASRNGLALKLAAWWPRPVHSARDCATATSRTGTAAGRSESLACRCGWVARDTERLARKPRRVASGGQGGVRGGIKAGRARPARAGRLPGRGRAAPACPGGRRRAAAPGRRRGGAAGAGGPRWAGRRCRARQR